MNFKVGDWIVIDYFGDVWLSKIKEIKDGIVVKPETEIYNYDNRWYHISRVRKATNEEIYRHNN